jgi:tetratricopeptide (TPR) repeat protein
MGIDLTAAIEIEALARLLTPSIVGEPQARAAHLLCRDGSESTRSLYWELVEIERLVCTGDYALSYELWCGGRQLWEGLVEHLEPASIVNDGRFRHRGLAAVAIRESRRTVSGAAAEAQRCALIAVAAIEGYVQRRGSGGGARDVLALAVGELANTQRLNSFASAALTLENARSAGARRKSSLARLLEISMVLQRDRRLFGDALRDGKRAIELWRQEDDPHCAAMLRVLVAGVYSENGESEDAISELRQALLELDPLREPTAVTRTLLAEALFRVELGQCTEALSLLDQIEPGEDRRMEARQCWIRGRALRGIGDLAAAQEALAQGLRIFKELGDLKNQVVVLTEDLVIRREAGAQRGLSRRAAALASALETLEQPREAQLARAVARKAGGVTLQQVLALQKAIAAASQVRRRRS